MCRFSTHRQAMSKDGAENSQTAILHDNFTRHMAPLLPLLLLLTVLLLLSIHSLPTLNSADSCIYS